MATKKKSSAPAADPTGTLGQLIQGFDAPVNDVGHFLNSTVGAGTMDVLKHLAGLVHSTTPPPAAAPATTPSTQADLTTMLTQLIGKSIAPAGAETQSAINQGNASMSGFESMMAPQAAAAFKSTEPGVQQGLQGLISGATQSAEGTPQLTMMQNLLGQMQNRALYYGLPLSQVYGNVTNPFLNTLVNSPTLQGLSASKTPGATQIGPNTYAGGASGGGKQTTAGGYPSSLPSG